MSEQAVFDTLAYRIEVDSYGNRFYYNNAGKWHRENGPAVEYANGSKRWYYKGQLHRTDGPAIEYPNGAKFWVQNNLLHRTDGPAVEYFNGELQWWIHGEHMSEAKYKQVVKSL